MNSSLIRTVQVIAITLITATVCLFALAAHATSYPTDYDFSIDQDDQQVRLIGDTGKTTTIQLSSKARNIQAEKYTKEDVEYAVVLFTVPKKRKVRVRVYHPDGTYLGSKTPYTWKKGRDIPSARLTKLKKNKFKVQIIRQNKHEINTKIQTKQFKVRPKKSGKYVLKRLKSKSKDIEKPERTGDDEADTLKLINYYRAIAGQLPVKENSEYSQGCEEHVGYMHLNQTITHYQDSSKPGYTELGARTGPSANVGGGTANLYENVDRWMASVYHRFPVLEPYVREVGFHYYNNVSCLYMDVDSNLYFVEHDPIPFPAPSQADSFYDFIGYETPDPLAGHVSDPDSEYPVGTVVSLQFSREQDIESMHVSVTDSNGNGAYGYTRLPGDDNDPNKLYQRNAVTYIVADTLNSGETYTATFSGVVDGKSFTKSWEFTTR